MQPNLVIVMTDQQRADLRRGCGYPLDTMPYLDRFAAGGMDFRCAYTPNPCCVPARISMFTGRYPSCHNARTNHNIRDVLCGDDLKKQEEFCQCQSHESENIFDKFQFLLFF